MIRGVYNWGYAAPCRRKHQNDEKARHRKPTTILSFRSAQGDIARRGDSRRRGPVATALGCHTTSIRTAAVGVGGRELLPRLDTKRVFPVSGRTTRRIFTFRFFDAESLFLFRDVHVF